MTYLINNKIKNLLRLPAYTSETRVWTLPGYDLIPDRVAGDASGSCDRRLM